MIEIQTPNSPDIFDVTPQLLHVKNGPKKKYKTVSLLISFISFYDICYKNHAVVDIIVSSLVIFMVSHHLCFYKTNLEVISNFLYGLQLIRCFQRTPFNILNTLNWWVVWTFCLKKFCI